MWKCRPLHYHRQPGTQTWIWRSSRPDNLSQLTHAARSIATIVANQSPYRHAPYVGRSAFAHKGGIHVAAMRRNILSYQHIDPALVGNEARVVVSELSGKGNLLSKAEDMGITHEELQDLPEVLQKIKELEHRGFTFEGAEASVEMITAAFQRAITIHLSNCWTLWQWLNIVKDGGFLPKPR